MAQVAYAPGQLFFQYEDTANVTPSLQLVKPQITNGSIQNSAQGDRRKPIHLSRSAFQDQPKMIDLPPLKLVSSPLKHSKSVKSNSSRKQSPFLPSHNPSHNKIKMASYRHYHALKQVQTVETPLGRFSFYLSVVALLALPHLL